MQDIPRNHYISARGDRYGANYAPAIPYLFLCEMIGTTLYHNCNPNCYTDSLLHQYLLSKTETTTDLNIIKDDIYVNPGGWPLRWISNQILEKTGKPLPDAFHDSKIYHDLRGMYLNKYGEKSPVSNSAIIHVRLDDRRDEEGGEYQGFIGQDNLINLINSVQRKFQLNIFLMTANNEIDKEICANCLDKSLFTMHTDSSHHVLGSDDMDYDYYLMMTSKVLIMSRSSFPFIPALLNENTAYSYTEWIHYFDLLGDLGSIKSNKIRLFRPDGTIE